MFHLQLKKKGTKASGLLAKREETVNISLAKKGSNFSSLSIYMSAGHFYFQNLPLLAYFLTYQLSTWQANI